MLDCADFMERVQRTVNWDFRIPDPSCRLDEAELDSLEILELVLVLEDSGYILDDDLTRVETFGDLVAALR